MIEPYLLLKWLHVLGATLLFGFGLGTAWYFWAAHRTGQPAIVAAVGRMVVRADWIFTGGSGLAQPITGLLLARAAGHSLTAPWLLASYALYLLALACWLPVVVLQIRAQRLAEAAARDGRPLGPDYRRCLRLWFLLGWPAFAALLAIFWLMIAKPPLWEGPLWEG